MSVQFSQSKGQRHDYSNDWGDNLWNGARVCASSWHLTLQTVICGNLQVTHGGGLMETLRLLTALQQRGGYINLLGLKPLELVRLGKMHDGIDARRRIEEIWTKLCFMSNETLENSLINWSADVGARLLFALTEKKVIDITEIFSHLGCLGICYRHQVGGLSRKKQ